MLKFVLGFVFAFVVVILCAGIYLKWGHPPVATADAPFPYEKQIVSVPLNARIDREMQQPPFAASEQVLENGAMAYKLNCAACHGVPGKDVAFARDMYPSAPQLWKEHPHTSGPVVVGVSDDDAGETYWKIRNGIRLTGMPAFQHVLNEEEMWDVALLLKSADKPLSPQVQQLLESK